MRKRILTLMAALMLFLTSCEKLPSMREILAYQETPITMDVHIENDGTFHGRITLTEDAVRLTLTDHAETEDITFSHLSDGSLMISHGDTELPLPDGALAKASDWLALFKLSADGLWKIKRDTMGGIAILLCTESERDVTLYLDAATLLPLKITQGNTLSIDILSASR